MGFSIVLPCAVIFLTCAAAAADPLRDQAKGLFEPLPDAAPAQPDNPVTPEKVALGKMLYFDPRLAESNDISCGTCHNLSIGGGGGRGPAVGHKRAVGGGQAAAGL